MAGVGVGGGGWGVGGWGVGVGGWDGGAGTQRLGGGNSVLDHATDNLRTETMQSRCRCCWLVG